MSSSLNSQHPLFGSYKEPTSSTFRAQAPPDDAAAFSSLPLGAANYPPSSPRHDQGYSSPPPGAYTPDPRTNQYAPGPADGQGEEFSGDELAPEEGGYAAYNPPGRVRSFFAAYNTKNQVTYLSLLLFQTVAVLTMIALVYGTINDATGDLPFSATFPTDPKLETVATYLGLFILAELFEILVSLDALMQKNIVQLALIIPFQVAMLVYSSVLPSQLQSAIYTSTADTTAVQDHVKGYAIAIPCVIGAVTVALGGMVMRLYGDFGWDVYKRIGADIALKRMYMMYQIFVCLLKFDAFFIIGFSIQFLVLVSGTPMGEKIVTIIALPVILICLLLAAVTVRFELRAGVYAFFALDTAGMAYFLYKLVRIFDPTSGDRYAITKKTLSIFSIISFLMLLVTFVIGGLCMSNFGRGLRENIPPYTWGKPAPRTTRVDGEKTAGQTTTGHGLQRSDTRMSLD